MGSRWARPEEGTVKGSTYKRCGCTDDAGKPLGAACPRLKGRSHGSWYYAADLPPAANGRRRYRRQGGFATQREAQAALTDLLDRVHKRVHVDVGKQTVADYLDQWLAGKAKLRDTTRRSYAEHITLYLAPGLGHRRLAEVSERDIEGLYAAMRQLGRTAPAARPSPELARLLAARHCVEQVRPLSAARLRRVHATLRAALNAAVKRRLIPRNPALHVELEHDNRPKPVVWTDERVAAWRAWRTRLDAAEARLRHARHTAHLARRRAHRHPDNPALARAATRAAKELTAAQDHHATVSAAFHRPKVAVWTPAQTGRLDIAATDRLYPLYHLIAFRGLRRGEAVGLPWTNVHLDRAELTVATQIVQLGWATAVSDPKADSHGTVALDRQTVAVLHAHRARQEAERKSWGAAWVDTGLVFTRENGALLHPDYVTDHFARLTERAGLPPIRLHDLRHGAATLALAGGADLKVVQQMLRHSSITITADTYTSVLPQVEYDAAEAASALVPRTQPTPDEPPAPILHPSQAPNAAHPTKKNGKTAGHKGWAAWGSNPEPAD